MKRLSFSRSELLKAIRFCFILLAFAAAQAKVQAQTLTVNGVAEPAPFTGTTGTNYTIVAPSSITDSDTLISLEGGSSTITIQSGVTLESTDETGIYLGSGNITTVNNAGSLFGFGSASGYHSAINSWYDSTLTVNNADTGYIYGSFAGVYSYDGLLTVSNSGYIGGERYGIRADGGEWASITNTIDGSIIGQDYDGIYARTYSELGSSSITVNNAGYVEGEESGIYALANSDSGSAMVSVTSTGEIDAYGYYGIFASATSEIGTGSAQTMVNNSGSVYGYDSGIRAFSTSGNDDSSATGTAITLVTNSGDIYSINDDGIHAEATSEGVGNATVTINNSGEVEVDSGDSGLEAYAYVYNGAGNALATINNTARVEASYGIYAGSYSAYSDYSGAGNASVAITNSGYVISDSAALYGFTYAYGTGNALVTINNSGELVSDDSDALGADAYSYYGAGNASIVINNSGQVYYADNYGINAGSYSSYYDSDGTGNASVSITNSASIYSYDDSIYGEAYAYGTGNSTVSINNSGSLYSTDDSTVVAYAYAYYGAGNAIITITNSGELDADDGEGIQAGAYASYDDSNGTGNASVTITNSGEIDSYDEGIDAEAYAYGSGNASVMITNSGDVYSDDEDGLNAQAYSYYGDGNASVAVSNSGRLESDDEDGLSLNAYSNYNGSGAGNASVWFSNSGTIDGDETGVNAYAYAYDMGNASTTVINTASGTIEGDDEEGINAYSFSSGGTATTTVINSGSVEAEEEGIQAEAYGDIASMVNVTNTGSIYSDDDDGIYVEAGGNGTINVRNSGSINSSGYGIYVSGSAASTIILAGGSINSGDFAVQGNGNSTVNILGRADLNNTLDGGSGTSTLTLKLAGMTPADKALLDAAIEADPTTGSVTVGGRTYTWQNFSGATSSSVSLQQVVNPELQNLATLIDNNAGSLGSEFDPLFVAAAADPNAALASLGGKQYLDARNDLALNLGTQLNGALMDRGYQLAAGMQGFTSSGLRLQDATMLASLGNIDNQLDILTAQTMSDSTRAPFAIKRSPERRWGTWISGTATVQDQSDNSTTLGYEGTTASPTVGIDYQLTPNLSAGVLAGYSNSNLDFSEGSTLKADTGLAGVYGAYSRDKWYATGLLSGAYTSYDNKRQVLGNTAASSPDGTQINAAISGGYNFKVKDWILAPELGVQYTRLMVDGYSETGAGAFNLNVGEQDTDSLRSQVGFRINRTFDLDWIKLSPSMRASWFHEFMNDSRGVDASLAGLGSFQVKTGEPERDFALLGVGLSGTFTESDAVTLFLNYNTQVGQQDYVSHSVNAGFRVGF